MSVSITSFGNKQPVQQNTNVSKNNVASQSKKTETGSLKDEFKKQGIDIPEVSPLMSGVGTAVLWFGIGFLFDKLLGKMSKNLKTPMKTSLAINGAIGLVAGIVSYIKAKEAE